MAAEAGAAWSGGAMGAAGRPRWRGMTSTGGCTDRAARTPRCAAARAGRGRRGVGAASLGTTSRDGGLGTTSRGGHGRAPAGDPRAPGEEGGGARGRAGWAAGRRRSEFCEGAGVICCGDGSVSAD